MLDYLRRRRLRRKEMSHPILRARRGAVHLLGSVLGLVVTASPVGAGSLPSTLMCFGNEPSWGLALERPGEARFEQPDAAPALFRGGATELPLHGERVWRGRADAGAGELVAFLRDAPCSDGMSDVRHPVTVRVSLPDGRVLAGCCRVLGAGSAGGAAPAAALEGPTWRLTSLPGRDAAFLAAVPDGVTVVFAAGAVQAFAGCNRLRGSFTIDGDRLTFAPMAGTAMACPPPVGAVEDAVVRALAGTQRFAVAGDTLRLVSAGGDTIAFARIPPPQLDGTSWTVTGFNNGRQAVVSPLTGTTLTLSFRDGRVSGDAGCNSFHASYTHEGDRLTIGRIATTRKACGAEGVMEQERQLVAALEAVTTWAIERDQLDLHRGDGERALTATRSGSAPGA